MENKKRDMNATEEQKQIIINFMEDNVDFGKSKFIDSATGRKKHNYLWKVLTAKLNSSEKGPTRDTIKWQRFWSDMKTRVKRKSAEIKKSRGATGGGAQNPKSLTDLEERILYFISPDAAYGVNEPKTNIANVRLESDIPLKRKRTEAEAADATREEAEIKSELNISAPSTPTSEVRSSFSPRSSPSPQTLLQTPSSSKQKKVLTSSDVSMLLQQQTELNMRIADIHSKLDTINSTLESNNNQTNRLLERIAVALEKWSGS